MVGLGRSGIRATRDKGYAGYGRIGMRAKWDSGETRAAKQFQRGPPPLSSVPLSPFPLRQFPLPTWPELQSPRRIANTPPHWQSPKPEAGTATAPPARVRARADVRASCVAVRARVIVGVCVRLAARASTGAHAHLVISADVAPRPSSASHGFRRDAISAQRRQTNTHKQTHKPGPSPTVFRLAGGRMARNNASPARGAVHSGSARGEPHQRRRREPSRGADVAGAGPAAVAGVSPGPGPNVPMERPIVQTATGGCGGTVHDHRERVRVDFLVVQVKPACRPPSGPRHPAGFRRGAPGRLAPTPSSCTHRPAVAPAGLCKWLHTRTRAGREGRARCDAGSRSRRLTHSAAGVLARGPSDAGRGDGEGRWAKRVSVGRGAAHE